MRSVVPVSYTHLLKYLLSRHLDVDGRSVHAVVIGEHGDSELAVWSEMCIRDRLCTSSSTARLTVTRLRFVARASSGLVIPGCF